jgi:hypothetical protein
LQVDRPVPFKLFYAHWRMFLSCKKIQSVRRLEAATARERLEAVRV